MCSRFRNPIAVVVNPGFFRTELLAPESTNYAERRVDDYDDARALQMEFVENPEWTVVGRPAKVAQALITISRHGKPPRRFIAGADAIGTAAGIWTSRSVHESQAPESRSGLPAR